jgi:hypothetical protein
MAMTLPDTAATPSPPVPTHDAPDAAVVDPRVARWSLWAGVALVVVHLGFRAWATFGSWFTGDDFFFVAHMTDDGTSLRSALEPHGGHLMPAGMYLSWLSDAISPYDYRFNAAVLLLLQAVADVGLLMLLVRFFGPRPGILPPLALYLFTVFSVPLAVWWAAGINQLALHAALCWGLVAVVSYLRTGSRLALVAAGLVVVAGLAFYEKSILVLAAYAFVALAYFATGSLGARIGHVWDTYRLGVVVLGGLGLAYVGLYAEAGLNFSAGGAGGDALGEVISNMTVQSVLPALVGGPLAWTHAEPGSLPQVGNLVALVSVAAVLLVGREIHRSRVRSLRAWILPGFFLVADILLVTAARASLVGPRVALDYRYAAELGLVTAIALALATLPLRGAVESAAPREGGVLLGHPDRVAALTALVAVLGVVSSVQYVERWQDDLKAKAYFDRLLPGIERAKTPVPMVDTPVPDFIVSPLETPQNLVSHLLTGYRDHVRFPDVATDELMMPDATGRLRLAGIPWVRSGLPGPRPGCGWAVSDRAVTIPRDGPVSFGSFWVRIGYLSSGSSPVVVTAGDSSYSTVLKPGVHALFVRGGDKYDSVEISKLAPGVTMCTDDVHAGRPEPRVGEGAQ